MCLLQVALRAAQRTASDTSSSRSSSGGSEGTGTGDAAQAAITLPINAVSSLLSQIGFNKDQPDQVLEEIRMKLGWETVPILRNRWVGTAKSMPATHMALKQTDTCLSVICNENSHPSACKDSAWHQVM